MNYEEKKFDLPTLDGLSDKQMEVHLGLYAGYVKHVNTLREKIHELESVDKEGNAYALAELRRRFPFEFNGMRMHEYYFEQFEGGSTPPTSGGAFENAVAEKYDSWEGFLDHFKAVAGSRGIGWTVLAWDPVGNSPAGEPHTYWVGDHELGQLAGLDILLALDMWEHAFMVDYTPAEKKHYIEAFFKNLNWSLIERRLG
ncbi:MAG: Fe-Mn family superoxide dismutase [Candidatus Paceibacterota bacterium]